MSLSILLSAYMSSCCFGAPAVASDTWPPLHARKVFAGSPRLYMYAMSYRAVYAREYAELVLQEVNVQCVLYLDPSQFSVHEGVARGNTQETFLFPEISARALVHV